MRHTPSSSTCRLTEIQSATAAPTRRPATRGAEADRNGLYRARDDRYVAAIDMRDSDGEFRLAYVVRAMSPGEFKYPAWSSKTCTSPRPPARTAIGKLTVEAR